MRNKEAAEDAMLRLKDDVILSGSDVDKDGLFTPSVDLTGILLMLALEVPGDSRKS
ncbi:MAG: hypothetical protein LKE81_09780 [Acetobacter sp.]|nr:hypothetical protein [Acetobacter sp.]MCH4061683.1 hypothetical protein [Acetobacter sp.]MCH4089468.1 hypothetical protein [Acetobacter sp.]